MRKLLRVAASWLLIAGLTRAEPEADATEPLDFAQGFELEIQPELSVQTLLLPLDVYRGTRHDQSDISVFNSKGELVPFAVRVLTNEARTAKEEREVPLFPLRRPASQPSPNAAVSLHVERASDGSVVDIRLPHAQRGAPDAGDSVVFAYVLDAEKLDQAFTGVRVEFEPQTESFATHVVVEGSDDLAQWSALSEDAVIGQLQHAGQSIVRTEVKLSSARTKFLRLRSVGGTLPTLTRAYLAFSREEVARERSVLRFQSANVRAKQRLYELDLGGLLPLVSVAPVLPENALIAATVALRSERDAQDEVVFEGQLYHVKHAGVELVSPALEVGARRARYVRLEVDPRTASALPGELAFDIRYAPDQLLFVTRGPAPYVLAYGSYKRTAPAFEVSELLAFLPEEARAALPRESAKVSSKRTLGGAAARKAPAAPPSYKLPLLWLVLASGAGMLLLLAVRQLRRMK